MTTLSSTLETPLTPDTNFPGGYSSQLYQSAFDFVRNQSYQAVTGTGTGVGSGLGGIVVTDLSTMNVLTTRRLDQMYAGTPYGHPAGSPPSQKIYDVAAGGGSDLYLLMDNGISGTVGEYCRLTRVDPATMKVTGEFYVSNGLPPPITCVAGKFGVVNTTATHTIVAYTSNEALGIGPQLFDGTGMAAIGLGPTPAYGGGYDVTTIPGRRQLDGSCDFLMLNPNNPAPATGAIDIWRINVTDGRAVTSIKTGTANIRSVFTPATNLYIAQADYDATHDAIILQLTDSSVPTGPPLWVVSVNYNGTIRWSLGRFATDHASPWSKGQSLLTGTTLTFGASDALKVVDTASGEIIFTGSILVAGSSAGSFYRVWDASRDVYYVYALGYAPVSITFIGLEVPPVDEVEPDPEGVYPDTPMVFLSWSDDRGHTFSNPVGISLGAVGEYVTSLQWQRLGLGRSRVFALEWSSPVRTALLGAWVDHTPAQT